MSFFFAVTETTSPATLIAFLTMISEPLTLAPSP
jgi:hypothetical protein